MLPSAICRKMVSMNRQICLLEFFQLTGDYAAFRELCLQMLILTWSLPAPPCSCMFDNKNRPCCIQILAEALFCWTPEAAVDPSNRKKKAKQGENSLLCSLYIKSTDVKTLFLLERWWASDKSLLQVRIKFLPLVKSCRWSEDEVKLFTLSYQQRMLSCPQRQLLDEQSSVQLQCWRRENIKK